MVVLRIGCGVLCHVCDSCDSGKVLVVVLMISVFWDWLWFLCFVMWLRYQTILLGGYITHKALEDATRIRSAYPHITIYLGVELAHRMWLVHLNLPHGT